VSFIATEDWMKSVLQKMLAALLICFSGVVFAQTGITPEVLHNSNDILASTVPIKYGDISFRERILKRTEGTRDPVGLVLSGGSARAFAHIGVLRYLEEHGIVPDFIISNSMGSIVGILYAAGLSPEQIFTVCSQLDTTQLFDLSWPLAGGFLDTSRFSSLVATYLGESTQLEDLPIPIMIVSEDIATKRQVQIMEGSVLNVFDAAFALPVYFPPVNYRGHLLIDGGFTNLVPLDIAYEYTDTAIVSTTFYEGKDINLRNALSVLNTSIDIAKRREGVAELQKHPDAIWIRCDVEDFSFMDFASIDELALRGYESAQEQDSALAALNARGTTLGMREFRANFSAREKQVLSDYRLFTRVSQHRLSQQLFMGLRSFNYEGDYWYLRDDAIFGLMYNLRWKDLWVSIHGGMGWKTVSPMMVYPGLSTSFSYHPIPPLLIEADIVATSETDILPSWYQRGVIHFKQNYIADALRAEITLKIEHLLSPEITLESMLVHTGASITWARPENSGMVLFAEGAWQLAGTWDRSFLHTKVTGKFPIGDIVLHMGYTGRFALDALGEVPFYREDGFKTTDATLLAQGTIIANQLIVGRFGVDWQPSNFKPTAGELLIFKDSSIGVYGEFLWNEASVYVPVASVGMQFSTTISLLGLNSLPTSLYVGYDGPANGFIWGFYFGRRI